MQHESNQGSVLVIAHEAAMRHSMAENLERAGYQVSCKDEFSEAEALAREIRPDIALLDWKLGAPGLTFARSLRSDRRTAEMSIIMLGACSDDRDAVAALESGADDYVRKPLAMRELLARVKAVLRRRAPQPAGEIVEISGLRLDPVLMCATSGGREIGLRKTEFNMLRLFMTHPGRTFTRRQILDELWDDPEYIAERTIDTHVRRLREALTPSHNGLIEAVHGVGYRLHTTCSASG